MSQLVSLERNLGSVEDTTDSVDTLLRGVNGGLLRHQSKAHAYSAGISACTKG
jgi:hypothetical protein